MKRVLRVVLPVGLFAGLTTLFCLMGEPWWGGLLLVLGVSVVFGVGALLICWLYD